MFGRKKTPRAAAEIALFDADGVEIARTPVADYALPEDVVIALSVEYFNDPEPCHIHRGAVHKRAMMELMEACPAGARATVSALPEAMRRYFPAGAAEIEIAGAP